MFDLNAKSRNKLFPNKPELSEQPKQKQRCDGNLTMTRLHTDVDENAAGLSVRGSSASSVMDDGLYETRAPGVVARLMGLDSLPKSGMPEPNSTPLLNSCSLPNAFCITKEFEDHQEQTMHSSSLQDVSTRNEMEPSCQRVTRKPNEKFQTKILPPKSAKPIPSGFIPSKDAARVTEAAARIYEPGPLVKTKTKLPPPVGSSSVPLRVRDLKEKAEAAQKPSKPCDNSRRKAESSGVKNLRGNSVNKKSWNGSEGATPTRVMPDLDESSIGMRNKGKSISLALLAMANVRKRAGLNVSSNRDFVGQKESCELSPSDPFRSQPTTEKSVVKKQSVQNRSSVLRLNNQKQNCIIDRGKLSSKCNSKGGRTLSEESSSTRQRYSSKVSSTSRVNSWKMMRSDVKNDRREVLSSCKERVTSKKRSVDGSYSSERNQATQNLQMESSGKDIQSRDIAISQSRWDQNNGGARSEPDSERPREAGEACKILSPLSSGGTSGSRLSLREHNNVKGRDALSTLLEEKLKELADKVESSQQKSGTDLHDVVPGHEATTCSSMPEACKARDGMHSMNEVALKEIITSYGNISRDRKLFDCRLPSPVSVLEHSPFPDSCSSSDTADSNTAGGCRQCISIQGLEMLDSYSLNAYLAVEPDAELSDSASTTSTGTVLRAKEFILTSTESVSPGRWKFEYVKEMLSNVELMFKDYAIGRSRDIVKPHLFYQLETCNQYSSCGGVIPITDQRLVFDCVSECLDLRCRQYVSGGYRCFSKGLSLVRRKEILAREVYREISGWSSNIDDSMIDELVDMDMSNRYGRWLDYNIEAFELGTLIQSRILKSLIHEVVADMLML